MTSDPSLHPSNAEPPDWEALARFIAGESAHDEAEIIAQYLAAHPEDARVLAIVKQSTATLAQSIGSPVDAEAALAAVLRKRDASSLVASEAQTVSRAAAASTDVLPIRRLQRTARPTRNRAWWQTPYAAAAAVLLMVGAAGWWRSSAMVNPAPMVNVLAAAGERESLELPDGTRVLLGPGSTLSYSKEYGVGSREVRLTGDGFFTVQPNSAMPFTVRAGEAVVIDLSTAFAVRSDHASGVRVVVTDGRVRLAHNAQPDAALELGMGETAVLATTSQIPERATTDTTEALAWTRGELVFVDAPIANVAMTLRRWFNVTVTVDSMLTNQRLTGRFDGEARDVVLGAIALSLGAELSVRGDTVLFRQPGDRAR